jgi:hypothetical protein
MDADRDAGLPPRDPTARLAASLGFGDDTAALERMLSMPSVAFDALSESHRRSIVRYLLDTDPPATLDDLATHVAARERRTSPAAVTAGERDEVAARLIHIHLPKLVAFGLIEWVPERGEVRLRTDDDHDEDRHHRATGDLRGPTEGTHANDWDR